RTGSIHGQNKMPIQTSHSWQHLSPLQLIKDSAKWTPQGLDSYLVKDVTKFANTLFLLPCSY
ncbi:MAG: hypothetical protein Q7U88_13620, partial [Desulfocapsaceae bacterium]|nr:hypothetical protein [Desulfocapsaceae bacterium]